MYSRARIAGHPIHPMLIAFPVALYVVTVVTLIVSAATGDPFWYRAALWANVAGVVMAAVAAVPGLIDLLGLPRHSRARSTGIRHAAFNVLALALFVVSAALLYGQYDAAARDVTAPLVLSILGVGSTLVAGWLGWTLVQTHHVGIQAGPGVEAEAGGGPGERGVAEPQMPATYHETFRTEVHN